jgi:ATP-dependent RNA helicase RhlB
VLELAYEHMNEPQKLTVDSGTKTVARVTQSVYFPATDEKMALLLGLLATLKPVRSIIFVNTKHIAERIQNKLERAGQMVATLSGDVPQRKRLTLLEKFKQGQVHMIVATDVAARGLHIPDVSHVFNYDLPFDAEDYVHRIGRTARFGSSGQAISFACEQYATSLPDIERYIEATIPRATVSAELLRQRPEPANKPDGYDAEVAADKLANPSLATAKKNPTSRRGTRSGGPKRPGSGPKSSAGTSIPANATGPGDVPVS